VYWQRQRAASSCWQPDMDLASRCVVKRHGTSHRVAKEGRGLIRACSICNKYARRD
jgi:hypothetical protein